MLPSEFQIPNNEHLKNNETVIGFERPINVESLKRDEYSQNPIISARKNVYDLYEKHIEVEKQSEVISKLVSRLYYVSDDITRARKSHLDSVLTDHAFTKTKFTEDLIKVLFSRELSDKYNKILTDRELKIEEGEIGANIFGPIAKNEQRLFFYDNLGPNGYPSWFYHEEKTDSDKNNHSTTLHYEVHPEGIWRINTKNGLECELINGQELDNFVQATEIYYQKVTSQIYGKTVNQSDKLAA